MKNFQKEQAKMQSRYDKMQEARNSKSGFKNTMSSGTQGAGDALRNNK